MAGDAWDESLTGVIIVFYRNCGAGGAAHTKTRSGRRTYKGEPIASAEEFLWYDGTESTE